MLKKIYRLSSVKLINARYIRTSFLDIKTVKNQLDHPRFGFVISKRIDKRAVVRNSLKRKLSASIEEIFDRIEGGHDFVFYPKTKIFDLKTIELKKEVEGIFKKEGFLNA